MSHPYLIFYRLSLSAFFYFFILSLSDIHTCQSSKYTFHFHPHLFFPLLVFSQSVQLTLHTYFYRAFAHISPSFSMEVAVVQTTPGGRRGAVDSLGPGSL